MATIKIEYPIENNGFEHLGNHYDCQFAIKRDVKMILQEAEISHKDTFNELYDKNTLRPNKIRIVVDGDNVPIYGMIIYLIDYKEGNITEEFGKKTKHYVFSIVDLNTDKDYPEYSEDYHYYPTYEEAVEAALKYSLENLI